MGNEIPIGMVGSAYLPQGLDDLEVNPFTSGPWVITKIVDGRWTIDLDTAVATSDLIMGMNPAPDAATDGITFGIQRTSDTFTFETFLDGDLADLPFWIWFQLRR